MDKDLHVDDTFKQSFNDGYTLAKELGLSKDSLQNIVAGNDRMLGMVKGIEQFEKEIELKKEKERLLKEMDTRDQELPQKTSEIDKDKGLDLEV